MRFENNEELRGAVVDGVLDCKGDNLVCDFNIDVKAHIINAGIITAGNITAGNVSYYAVCFVYGNITCNNITGRRNNSKHFCLDGKITIKNKKGGKK